MQRFNTLTDNAPGYQADEIRNNRYIHTKPIPPAKKAGAVPSLGFAITESTIFAPWRPWYTGHYCAKSKDHVADSVCYEDYFTTQLVAPADPLIDEVWLRDAPAVFIPSGKEPNFTKFCASGVDACDFYLGKVDWRKYAWLPQVSDCGGAPILTCRAEVIAKTANLDLQFNEAIAFFPDHGRYPWNGEQKKWYEMPFDEQKNLSYNPFIGFYDLKRYSTDGGGEPPASLFKGTHYVLPKQCTKDNFLGARQGILDDIEQMADCALNFEIHSSGFHEQWKELWDG